MYLAFDTETSGLLIRDKPLDAPEQPRLVQLGAIVCDRDFNEVITYRALIKPVGWSISTEAERVHGIGIEDCIRYGVPIRVALAQLIAMIGVCRVAVGHNFDFDESIVERELRLVGARDEGFRRKRIRDVCTMKTGAMLTDDGQWPSLRTLHVMLTGEEVGNAHDGLADARAAMRCFRELLQLRVVEL